MRKFTFVLTLSLLFCSNLFSLENTSEKSDFNLFGSKEVFELSPLTDGLILGGGAALVGTDLLCSKVLKLNRIEVPLNLNKSSVPAIDQPFMHPYSKKVDLTSTGVECILFASPLLFTSLSSSEWFTIGTMYVETLMWAYGIKEFGKFAVNRARPYMYFSDIPQKYIENYDWAASFPSGHAAFSFSAAAFTTFVFSKYYPDSKWKYVVGTGCYTLAACVGTMRLFSGNHFFTDVITGTVIGCASGILVPYLHTIKPSIRGKELGISVTPQSLEVSVRL